LTQEYSLHLVTTQEEFEAVKRLRSEVLNHKYAIYPELKNSQWYLHNSDDCQSFHYLLQHNQSQKYVGTVRIFFINKDTPLQRMPMQKECHIKTLSPHFPIGEISRFILSKHLIPHEHFNELQLRTYLSLALMIAVRINAFLYRYSTLYSIMEPTLQRILQRQNAYFEPIGEAVEYYGIRLPYAINREKLLYDTEENVGNITRYYLKKLCQNPQKFWYFIDNHPYLKRSNMQLEKISSLFERYHDTPPISSLLR